MGNAVSTSTRYGFATEGRWTEEGDMIMFGWSATYGQINLRERKLYYATNLNVFETIPKLKSGNPLLASMDEIKLMHDRARLGSHSEYVSAVRTFFQLRSKWKPSDACVT